MVGGPTFKNCTYWQKDHQNVLFRETSGVENNVHSVLLQVNMLKSVSVSVYVYNKSGRICKNWQGCIQKLSWMARVQNRRETSFPLCSLLYLLKSRLCTCITYPPNQSKPITEQNDYLLSPLPTLGSLLELSRRKSNLPTEFMETNVLIPGPLYPIDRPTKSNPNIIL